MVPSPRAAGAAWEWSGLQISPTQRVPWHFHTNVQDTFYVLVGRLRLFLRRPKEEVGLGEYDYVPLTADPQDPRASDTATAASLPGPATPRGASRTADPS